MKKAKRKAMKQEKRKIKRSRSGTIKSAQDSIPFREWYENKIFRLNDNTYSLIFAFDNAGYLSKTDAEKERKYNAYRAMLCELPEGIHYEEIVYNCPMDSTVYLNAVASKTCNYENEYEAAFFDVQRKFVGGVDKDHSRQKYLICISLITLGDESPYGKLHETYVQLNGRLRELGSNLIVLSPEEVFAELHHCYTPFEGDMRPIPNDIYRKGLTVRDFIAPNGITYEHDHIRLGSYFARVLSVNSYGNVAVDNLEYTLCANDLKVYITKHIDHIDKGNAVKQIKKQLNEALGRRSEKEEKKRPIPVDLTRTIEGCEELIDAFANGEEFLRQTMYVSVFAETLEDLNAYTSRLKSTALTCGTTLGTVTVQTKEAFNSILPLGKDYCMLHQFLLAGEAAVMTPFSYESYFDSDGFFYGKNYFNDEPIIRNRKKDKSSHGFVFGATGSGKGMWVKNELANVLWQPSCKDDHIIIVDPSGEYIPIARAIGGNVIEFSSNGETHINPLAVSSKRVELEGTRTAQTEKIRSVIALLSELKCAGGLDGIETAIIDRAAMNALEQSDPTLETLEEEIAKIGGDAAQGILEWLRRYTKGSVTLFSGADTTSDTPSRLTVYALHKLPSDIRDAVMLIMLDRIEDAMIINRHEHRWTWIYIDEMHRYFDADRNPLAAERFARLYSEARKNGGILTGITQLPLPVIASRDGSTMLSNSRFVVMSELDDRNIEVVTEKYGLNEDQKRTLYSPEIGQYVLRTANAPMSVKLLFPSDNALFDLFNTSFIGG